MAQLTQMELNLLREMIGPIAANANKLADFAQHAQDPQLKSFFENAGNGCRQQVGELMGFLS